MTLLKLQENLTITAAADLKAALLLAIGGNGDLTLDATDVREVDLAGLQLLCAAVRSARPLGKAVSFAEGKRSAAIDEAARVLGFDTSDEEPPSLGWRRSRSSRG